MARQGKYSSYTLLFIKWDASCVRCSKQCKGTRAYYKSGAGVICPGCYGNPKYLPEPPKPVPPKRDDRKPLDYYAPAEGGGNPDEDGYCEIPVHSEWRFESVKAMTDWVEAKQCVAGAEYYRDATDFTYYQKRYREREPKEENSALAKVRARIEGAVQPPLVKRRRIRRGRDGDDLDIDAYLGGDEKPWLRSEKTWDPKSKVVKILCGNTTTCARSPENMATKGAMICVLVEELERRGIQCEVEWCFLNRLGNRYEKNHATYCVVKHAGTPASECALFDSVCRYDYTEAYICYSTTTTCENSGECGGYGHPYPMKKRPKPCDIWVPDGMMTEEQAVERILRALRSQGVME